MVNRQIVRTLAITGLAVCLLGPSAGAQQAAFFIGEIAPLATAVARGDRDAARKLLAAGADPHAPTGNQSMTPWHYAILLGDRGLQQLFEETGPPRPAAETSAAVFKTALQRGDAALVATIVKAGLPLAFGREEHSPLMIAAANGSTTIVAHLLAAGAPVDAQDRFGDTALMAAVRAGSLPVVRALLARGADPQLRDERGRTAIAWALRVGRRDIFDALRRAGALGEWRPTARVPLAIDAAITRSVALLERSAVEWNRQQKCAACHMQPLMTTLADTAARTGHRVDPTVIRDQALRLDQHLAATDLRTEELYAKDPDAAAKIDLGFFGGAVSGVGWLFYGQAVPAGAPPRDHNRSDDGGEPSGRELPAYADRLLTRLAAAQRPDGSWRTGAPRPPMTEDDVATTAVLVRALQAHPGAVPDAEARIARARAWLAAQSPRSTDEHAYRILGLRWAGAEPATLRDAARALRRLQQPGGGWSQKPGLMPDAYATGIALRALREGAGEPVTSHAWRAGVRFLLETQEEDGSWFVAKRAASYNRYFESGFPHEKHQFGSFVGSIYATTALMDAAARPPRDYTGSAAAGTSPGR